MTAKAILDVDVKDEAFKRLKAEYDKFQEAVKGMPGDWAKIGAGIGSAQPAMDALVSASGKSQQTFDKMLAAMLSQHDALGQISGTLEEIRDKTGEVKEETEKASSAAEKFLQFSKSSGYAMAGVAKGSKDAAFWIKDATTSLLKWTGIVGAVSGLLGAGGIWGIDRLALSAGNARRSAGGLGITSGEQQAFGINFGRFVDPGSTLESIADAQTDMSKRWIFSALGINNPGGRDAADLAPDVVRQAKALFDRNPTAQGAQAYGLDQIFSMDELRRLHGTSYGELDAAAAQNARDRGALAVNPEVQRAWQNLTGTLQRAGQAIENTFIVGLEPLAGPLVHLSDAFQHVVEAFLKAPIVEHAIGKVADGLETFASFVGTQEFKDDIEGFVHGLGRIADFIGAHFPKSEAAFYGGGGGQQYGPDFGANRPAGAGDGSPVYADPLRFGFGLNAKQTTAKLLQYWRSQHPNYIPAKDALGQEDLAANLSGVPKDFARAIFRMENGINPDGSPRISLAGAIGAGQMMPGTAQELGINPFDTGENIMGSVRYMAQLLNKYNGDRAKAAAAYNWGMGNVDKDISEHHADWLAFAPRETKRYVAGLSSGIASAGGPRVYSPAPAREVAITVNNNTGGSAVITASQAAAGP